ncbi:MAG TPA: hypothetical protein VGH99_14385 [Pseudonocardia sp.]|jgi:hypothetical protein
MAAQHAADRTPAELADRRGRDLAWTFVWVPLIVAGSTVLALAFGVLVFALTPA